MPLGLSSCLAKRSEEIQETIMSLCWVEVWVPQVADCYAVPDAVGCT
jgi:hypothetical protein